MQLQAAPDSVRIVEDVRVRVRDTIAADPDGAGSNISSSSGGSASSGLEAWRWLEAVIANAMVTLRCLTTCYEDGKLRIMPKVSPP